jgi:hypothetical protein
VFLIVSSRIGTGKLAGLSTGACMQLLINGWFTGRSIEPLAASLLDKSYIQQLDTGNSTGRNGQGSWLGMRMTINAYENDEKELG